MISTLPTSNLQGIGPIVDSEIDLQRIDPFNISTLEYAVVEEPLPSLLGDGTIDYKYFLKFICEATVLLQRYQLEYCKERDRYSDVIPFIHNQVDNTNGSWIAFPKNDLLVRKQHIPSPYIAISAPMPEYFHHFLEMLDKNNCQTLVTLTDPFEGYYQKAHIYLPKLKKPIETKTYTISCQSQEVIAALSNGWVVKKGVFEVEFKANSDVHQFTNFHVSNWHDRSEGTSDAILDVIKFVHAHKTNLSCAAPIVVHCSAGIGRAGLFINGFEILQRKGQLTDHEVFTLAAQARLQRFGFGGNQKQYEMLYKIRDKVAAEHIG